jgi:hypothetical protein
MAKWRDAPSDRPSVGIERLLFGHSYLWVIRFSAGICCGCLSGGGIQYHQSHFRMWPGTYDLSIQ